MRFSNQTNYFTKIVTIDLQARLRASVSAVSPGDTSNATGQPWPSTATHSTGCGRSGRRSRL
jgi:hypothetical protein